MKKSNILIREEIHSHVPVIPCVYYHGLCRLSLALAMCVLIQIFSMDVCDGRTIFRWVPFQVKTELVLISDRSNVGRKTNVPGPFVKVWPSVDIGMEPADLINPLEPGIYNISPPATKTPFWIGNRLYEHIFPVLPSDDIRNERIISSDIFRDIINREQLQSFPSGNESATYKNGSSMHYFKLSLFNREWQYFNKDAPERDMSRYNMWEMLMSSPSNLRHQPFMETMGKVFEPKVDLQIEF